MSCLIRRCLESRLLNNSLIYIVSYIAIDLLRGIELDPETWDMLSQDV